ncbi:uncharacterized protein BCR38DRAFT_442730 [Pseudomassariella vexata]|uniref:Secreted protein n=1 Tax=Pseudomassariella vexata TaxID=1141098 RepID=A0A1Y2DNT5_9PEZI|nr:uncharacterized protein BCR38DRAFT_442730 [Pseudomassariella vexata]ORY60867.1 hypothetical protein BCR38DRAFT_442730 [Pseudomassariella vexata]
MSSWSSSTWHAHMILVSCGRFFATGILPQVSNIIEVRVRTGSLNEVTKLTSFSAVAFYQGMDATSRLVSRPKTREGLRPRFYSRKFGATVGRT